MDIVFFGTPEFAKISLKKLVESSITVRAVVTAPDRPAGRGLKIKESEVKQYAKELSIPILQPEKLRDPNFLKELKLLGKNNLMILKKMETNNLVLAMRNIPNITFVDANSLNTYMVLKSSSLIFVENALEVFKNKQKNVTK